MQASDYVKGHRELIYGVFHFLHLEKVSKDGIATCSALLKLSKYLVTSTVYRLNLKKSKSPKKLYGVRNVAKVAR